MFLSFPNYLRSNQDDATYFTSESVSEGHPDKIADQISDAILDELLLFDENARVGCETLCKTGLIVIAGEVSFDANTIRKNEITLGRPMMSYEEIARKTVESIGYDDPNNGFDYRSCGVIVAVNKQSPDISQGVSEGQGLHKEQGAGDQGVMFGYAVNETPELMPASLQYAHSILQKLANYRKIDKIYWLRPDAKSQVTVQYDKEGNIVRVDTVVISTMHTENISHEELSLFIIENVIKKCLPPELLDEKTKYFINPTGKFVIGGPQGDCGLTGRKIIIDTYGGHGSHGGGAFSGKDPSKVDRSASYMCRYIAKNIVSAGFAKKILVQIAYAIGYSQPVSMHIETFATETVDKNLIKMAIKECFDLTPTGIIKTFDLKNSTKNNFNYRETACYGHFGREKFPWEKLDQIETLKKSIERNSKK